VVIKCEGWACTIVKDFEPAEKPNQSRSRVQGGNKGNKGKGNKGSRVQGGNKGMYSSSEASVSRADSPVIFVVGDKTRQPESYAAVANTLGATRLVGFPTNHPLAEMQRTTVNLQLQRESLVKKQRRDLVKPLSAKSSRSSSSEKGCCRIVADAISTFVQGIFYCIIFPALVMVGPAGLLYMLYQCYVENDVSVENLLDLVGYNKVESHISDIRGNVEEAVDGVKKLASLRRYNATHSVLGTRYYGSKEDYDKDAQTKYDNSRRYRDPISINDRSIVEDLTNVTAKNVTLTRGWKECNVILFPILVFGVFCLAVVLVLIRYKVCANYDEEEKEESGQAK